MASHFSIGFVIEASPKRPVIAQCATLQDRYEIMTIWPRNDGHYCVDTGCIAPGSLCVPRGDDAYIIFSVYDTDGDEFDISGAAEIVFAVADYNGGEVRFVKRLTDSEIQISSNMYQFMVTVTSADTESLVRAHNYYEARVTTGAGLVKTVSAGLFKSTDTIIKDIA